jgi:magnesium transporter
MDSAKELDQIAGARITTKFLSVSGDELSWNVKQMITGRAKELEVLDYVYVIDDQGKLLGVVSLKEILRSEENTKMLNLMKSHPVSVDFHTDQERLIYLVLEHDLKALPVVDTEEHLKGIVPYHAILKVFHHEYREDILRSGGIQHRMREIEDMTTPASKLVRARLPSLVLGLLGGLFAAYMITGFEQVLGSYLALAAFIPVMVYLSDAVGTQSQTLIVRMIALQPDFSVRKYMTRELKIGGVLGIIFAILLFVAGTLGWGGLYIGFVVGSSMFLSIIFQALMAAYLSATLARRKIDPALASGPLTTIISDVTSLALYFAIASVLLRYA